MKDEEENIHPEEENTDNINSEDNSIDDNQDEELSEEIRKDFNWERVAEIGINTINEFLDKNPKEQDTNKTIISYLDGPRVEIKGNQGKKYFVEFVDGNGKVRFSEIGKVFNAFKS